MKRVAALAVTLAAAALAVAGCGGHSAAKNAIRGSTTNQLSRCTPRDTTHACVLAQHPKGAVLNAPPPLRLAPRAGFSEQRGVDFAWSCPDPNGSYGGAGIDFALSYVSPDGSKNWSKGCIDWYLQNHKRVGINYESNGTTPADGWQAGHDDAVLAEQQAAYLLPGVPVVVIFSIDFDASCTQTFGYFQGVDSVLGVSRAGAYGGITPITCLFNAGLISHGWQAYAWSYGQWDSRALIEQWLNGDAWDYDRTIGQGDGLYPPNGPPPPPPDPYKVFPHTSYSFGKYRFNEYHAAIWHDRLKCRLPLRRAECFALNGELAALDGRLLFVAYHHPTAHGWVKNRKPDWHTADRGSRHALLQRRLHNYNPTHL